jgi:hypothetical protein
MDSDDSATPPTTAASWQVLLAWQELVAWSEGPDDKPGEPEGPDPAGPRER